MLVLTSDEKYYPVFCVGYNSYIDAPEAETHAEHVIHLVEVFLETTLI